jgi:beta-lactamase regulating signal transducer with metallopeptidase domain
MQVLTHFPLLKALGWALFDSLWQMAALWLLYCLLLAVFRSAAARIRHRLALLLLSIGAVWTGVTFVEALFFPEQGGITWLPFLSSSRSAPAWFWQTGRAFIDAVLAYGSSLYLLVLAGLLVRYSSHYWHTRTLTRKGISIMPAEFRVFIASTALQLGIDKPVRAWRSSLIDVPLTLGFLKPVILIPAAMISQLTPQQVEAILIHELSHIQRKDYLLHLLVTLLEGIFFFNPFARLLIHQLKKEREHCCDDLVLQFKYDPHSYVTALLSLATRLQPVPEMALAATGNNDKLLLERARRILLQKEDNRRLPGTRPITLLLVTGLITALALYRPHSPALRPAGSTGQPALSRVASQRAVRTTIATAVAREFAFSQTMRSAAPAPAHSRLLASPGTAKTRKPDSIEPDANNNSGNTGDDALFDDDAAAPLMLAADNETSDDRESVTTPRDYSLIMPPTASGPSITIQEGAPVVPNSSFSFQYTQGDSARPEEQLLYLQQSAEQDVMAAITKLQHQTAAQLKALANLQSKATESVHLRSQIRSQQKKLQLDYLRKINTWQQKLEKTVHVRMIVYI